MYLKFDHLDYARSVFDNMFHRNEASWNNMISGLVRKGLYEDSFNFFKEMVVCEISPSGFAVSSLMAACDRSGDMFCVGIVVHGLVIKSGLLADVFVSTSILHFYGSYRMAFCSRLLFEEMPEKNIVSWTSLMVAYMECERPSEVINLYSRMRSQGVDCNANNMATVITSCVTLEDELLGRQVVSHAIKFGLDSNTSVSNTLMSLFGSFGCVEEAMHIFSSMDEHDTISWNSLISVFVNNGYYEKSLECFHWMRHNRDLISSATLSSLLSGCVSVDDSKCGREIHGLVWKFGFGSNICVCNTLLNMYSSAGEMESAELIFRKMKSKDTISWNSIMTCYAENCRSYDVLRTFCMMPWWGQNPDFVSFTSALVACSEPDYVLEGKIMHALVIARGLHENLVVGNTLITMYSKMGMMEEARKIFLWIPKRDEISWNAIIGGYADNGVPNESLRAFKLMRQEPARPNYITITNILGACSASDHLLKLGMPVHAFATITGLQEHSFVRNSLITMYAKCGDLKSSLELFNKLNFRDEISWNALIAATVHNGQVEEALKLFVHMRREAVEMGQFTFSESISAAAKLSMFQEGQQLHGLAIRLGFIHDHYVTNATMDLYGKCGELDDMLQLAPDHFHRSRLSWNVLISSFARNGQFSKAVETFHEMINSGMKPDHVTFVCLLSACNHGGLVEEGLTYYHSMWKEFEVPIGIEHCVCIIDLLGRAGRLTEAEKFIRDMPVPPTHLVWRSLLHSSKLHGNVELGRKAAGNLFEIDSKDDSAYVLLSNVCATSGKWDDMEMVRERMESSKVLKQAACSWIKIKDRWSSFGMGAKSHPQTALIYSKLEELKKLMCEAGYIPDTTHSLQDTDEEQKEHNLWIHSERLGLAFGLINSPEGSTIKIFKNIRVCADCHSFFKVVSRILSRKLVLRDPYRFHHFSNGVCSCSDYW